MAEKKLKITLVRSMCGTRQDHRDTVRGLGLKRMHHTVVRPDRPEIRGMIHKIDYMLRVEEA